MGLEEIAAQTGTITQRQRSHGVPAVDDTGDSLTDRLRPFASDLPCSAAAAATLVRTHGAGTPIDASARAANLSPVTAAKTLHRVGFEGVCPLAPTAREIVRDWIAGELTRADAQSLTDASTPEFALAAYIETHDPLPGARDVIEAAQAPQGDAMVDKCDHLDDTLPDAIDLP
ncbi:MAG: hypothetical protein ABEJ57_01045 [Halobacteriaceae archaeon]